MKSHKQLINNIIGQLNGVSRMLDEEKECLSVITQMKAVHSAVGSLINKFVEENFIKCTKSYGEEGSDDLMKKLLIELTKK